MRFTAAFVTIAAANLAAATAIGVPVRRTDGGDSPSNQCNTGTISCCNSVQSSSSSLVTTLAGLLGVVLGGVTGQVGVSCSPITVVGASGTSWYAFTYLNSKQNYLI